MASLKRRHVVGLDIPCTLICGTALIIPNILCAEPEKEPRTARQKKMREKCKETIAALGAGYFVVEPRFEWGEMFGNLIESYAQTE